MLDFNNNNSTNEFVVNLLIPRYQLLCNFPGNLSFKVGEVYTEDETLGYLVNEGINGWDESYNFRFSPDEFPNVFKKLEWWECRTEEEMPTYLRYNGTFFTNPNRRGKVIKPYKYILSSYMQVYLTEEDYSGIKGSTSSLTISVFNPASEEEFGKEIANNVKVDINTVESDILSIFDKYKN